MCDTMYCKHYLSIHWSVCWLKKTENKRFDFFCFFFLPILWLFTLKWSSISRTFYTLFLDDHIAQATHKSVKSIFSTVLVMSAVQNDTLKNWPFIVSITRCQYVDLLAMHACLSDWKFLLKTEHTQSVKCVVLVHHILVRDWYNIS